jgi:hypothetical protein
VCDIKCSYLRAAIDSRNDDDESRCGVGNDLPLAFAFALMIDAVANGLGAVVFGEIEFRRRRFMPFRLMMLDVRLS